MRQPSALLKNLTTAIHRFANAHGGGTRAFQTAIDGLTLIRATHPTPFSHRIYRPALCVVAQGSKWTMLGDKKFVYQGGQALVVSVEMPVFGRVAVANEAKPFLGVTIELDLAVLREVFAELDSPPIPRTQPALSTFVMDLDRPFIDCALRALNLLDTPTAIPILYRSIMREICYRLLTGPHGKEVSKLALPGNRTQRVIDAIYVLRDRFTEPIRVEDLAKMAHMSPSAFYQHFKSLTSLSPLQYQKQLRLLEAKRLMISEAVSAETAAYEVGYESPSQFSREYSRMFGIPPRRDVIGGKSVRTASASLIA